MAWLEWLLKKVASKRGGGGRREVKETVVDENLRKGSMSNRR